MARKALHRAVDGVLLEHGFIAYVPDATQFVRDVPDDFALIPLNWAWNGAQYVAVVPVLSDMNDFQNLSKAFRAKCISDVAFRLGIAPGAVTLAQIQTERTRLKNIADALP